MSFLEDILKEVNTARSSFKPISPKSDDMEEFQLIAKALIYANDEGYFDSFIPHRESETGYGWYDLIIVSNGLSHKGHKYLSNTNDELEIEFMDAIQLKPSAFGVTVDLKVLWQKLKQSF